MNDRHRPEPKRERGAGGDEATRPYQRVLDLVAREYGLTLAISTRPHLAGVLDRATRASQCASIEHFADLLSSAPRGAAMTALVRGLVVGETYFFRNPPQFRELEHTILPALIAAARERAPAGERPRLRVWSAGCATGEEPYSVAMLLLEAGLSPESWALEIVGTDLQDEWLKAAGRGHYARQSVERNTSPERRLRFFTARDGGYLLSNAVRALVSFRVGNLLSDVSPMRECDLVLCRNVTIYFSQHDTAALCTRLAASLGPGGVLLTGHAETIDREAVGLVPAGHPGAFAYRRPTSDGRLAGGEQRFARRPGAREKASVPLPPAIAAPGAAPPAPPGRAVELDPATYLQRGTQHAQAGDLDDAIAALRRCVFLAPDLVGARFLLGTMLQRAGRLADAQREYRAVATSLHGRDPSAAVPGTDGFDVKTLLNAARRGLSSR